LYRGVYPMSFDVAKVDCTPEGDQQILRELKRWKAVEVGDLVVITRGDRQGVGGGTNSMKIVRVEEAQALQNTIYP
jgi:pyruvate kinase